MTINAQSQPTSNCDQRDPALASGAILDALDAGVLLIGEDLSIRYRNRAAAGMLPEGNDVESAFRDCQPPGTFAGWNAEIARIIREHRPLRLECTLPGDETSVTRPVTLHCTPLPQTDSDRVTGVAILIDDSRERKNDVDRLEVSQRMASLGKLAAQVAHELNNPLDGILRYINLALRLADDATESKLKSYLSESRTGLIRMVQIIGELLEFSRTTEGEFDEADINELVEQAIRNTVATADIGKIVISEDFQTPDMPTVRGSRLYQVCGNLIKNAIDAMPDGGRLAVTTGVVDDEVVIRVTDTGVGLPDEVDRVFEPFFTTKAAGQGTGLGLAICRDFVEDMHGTITAAPGEEGGAVFTIRIPISSCHRRSLTSRSESKSGRRLTGP